MSRTLSKVRDENYIFVRYTFQKSSGWSLYHWCINSIKGLFLIQISEVRHIFQDCCIKLKLLACCFLLKKYIVLWGPPGYMAVTREPKFIFLCTLTCPKCRTWYYFKCNLFSKILEFVRTGEYSPMFPLPSANTIIIENISVYKHWRHIRSRAQNHLCVWLAVALSSWSSPLLTDEFPTQFSVSILGFL